MIPHGMSAMRYYYWIQILLILLKYWLKAKHQFNQINPYSFIIEYRFCWLYWYTGPKRSISLIRIIRIHLLLNTDSADFTDILAQGEASVNRNNPHSFIIEYKFCWFYWYTGPKRSISLIRIIRIHLFTILSLHIPDKPFLFISVVRGDAISPQSHRQTPIPWQPWP